jgi:asparagine synthase (glutamine-hydrolysing)
MPEPKERVVDLLDPALNQILNMREDEARRRLLSADPEAVRGIEGSFALLARDGITVRMARSLDRPMRYFLAKRKEGPALFVSDRIDALHQALEREGLFGQFHPSYTRMVPAHHVVEVRLLGCPDPDPTYMRFLSPRKASLPPDLDAIGRHYVGALAAEIRRWLLALPGGRASREPIGVCFSGGIDSGSVFLVTCHVMRTLGLAPTRLKAFTLDLGKGEDRAQARAFLEELDLGLFLEDIEAPADALDLDLTLRVLEDYKPLDVECAAVGLLLCRGIRDRYPGWVHLLDGDGGDENLKDYPIEANPELTIRSVVDNLMLYHEGWGVGKIKHSLTYSGGLSRSYARTYAPARHFGFRGFSPYTRPAVVEAAENIPFAELTGYDLHTLYALKGEVVRRGVRALTGYDMPVFEKRRFQTGVVPEHVLRSRLGGNEAAYRQRFLALYS